MTDLQRRRELAKLTKPQLIDLIIDIEAGDYDRPGWDDRKQLADLWQDHAQLPDIGLNDGVYEALIAVANWGYDRRRGEER